MNKIIVLKANEVKDTALLDADGANFRCLTGELNIAPRSQVCLVAYDIDTTFTNNEILLVNIQNLPIQAPIAKPHNYGYLQTIGIIQNNKFVNGNDGTNYDGKFEKQFLNWVNLDNQEELHITDLHVLITDALGQKITTDSQTTTLVIKFRQDPNFVAQSNLKIQSNLMRDIMFERQTQNRQAQII